jgi:AcrR family transcriptional regulator
MLPADRPPSEPDPMNLDVPRRPRTKPPEQRRDDLMNAAQRLFIGQGVGPTTIDQIAAGAAVAKGTFYLYFSSKEDVLAALRERYVANYVAGIEAAVARQPKNEWPGLLSAWVKAAIDGHLDAVSLHDIVFPESRPSSRAHAGAHRAVVHLARLLRAGNAAKAWSVDDPDFTALFLFHALHGGVHDTVAGRARFDRKRLIRDVQRLFLRLVGVPSV